ncbi:MAG: hypothetical protein COU69_02225 [Candidatus Pacebacteria bacterium CG10_big_fil_rev_8_21_14_0_10_56_10]|nr:MAG: hypothetical protein COU69_02225 [Candidatus Pacebacteria bacterium CG10_big_fil_rev_8_21_14_0_10_56_10]
MEIQLSTLIFQIINFGIVVGAMSYLMFKPITKILEERAQRVAEGQKAAEQQLAARDKLANEEKKILQKAKKEAAHILEEARQSAAQTEKELLIQSRRKAEREVDRLREQWQEERAQLISQQRQQFNQAVLVTTEKVVGKFSTKQHQQIIDVELKQLLKTLKA